MKIRPVETELFHADGQADRRTDMHDEANSRFSLFYEGAKNALLVVPSTQNAHYDKFVTGNWIFNCNEIYGLCTFIPVFSLEPQLPFMKQTHRNPFRQRRLFLMMQC